MTLNKVFIFGFIFSFAVVTVSTNTRTTMRSTSTNTSTNTGIIVPAYFPWWRSFGINSYKKLENFASVAHPGDLIVVFNPSSGPGESGWYYEALTRDFITKLRRENQHPVGYVSTDYANRAAQDVKNDMDTYLSIYGDAVSGFFLDETNASRETKTYYQDLNDYGHAILNNESRTRVSCLDNFGVILNAGTISDPLQELSTDADLVIISENTEGKFLEQNFPELQTPNKKAALVYSCDNYRDVFNKVQNLGIRYFYCTDRNLDENPWLSLAGHWYSSSELIAG